MVVLLHLIFLTLVIAGVSIVYENSELGKGADTILEAEYEDSDAFQEQFQEDLDHVFHYVAYKDAFETNGNLDISKEMFSVSKNDGPEMVYTLDEVLRYAKSQGYYLDRNYKIVNDLYVNEDVSMPKDYVVSWRSYPVDNAANGPGDVYVSLLDLAKEVMTCISEYYTVHYRMMEYPSNFLFRVVYDEEPEELPNDYAVIYTNCPELSVSEIKDAGRYCYMSSESAAIDTNLLKTPHNITISMENNNFYDSADFYIAASVNTEYPAEDIYREKYEEFLKLKKLYKEGILVLILGIAGMAATLCYLISVSGYQTSKKEKVVFHYIDVMTTESCIALTVICTLFMLFLTEKAGIPLLHLLLQQSMWRISERLLNAAVIYLCCFIGGFSILRRFKAHVLWDNSMLHQFLKELKEYYADHTFVYRLGSAYGAFLAVHVIGIGGMAAAIILWRYTAARVLFIVLLLIMLVVDYKVYRKLYLAARQEDKIADAIRIIAEGNTSYQMELDDMYGKERKIAENINLVGTGLERAIQEQFKSERLKADLITNVSHDIKTPLTSIINYVDLIKREKIPNERLKEYVSVLEQKAHRLKTLTEDLVEASKASSGNLKMDMMKLDLVEMIWQTNGEFEEKYMERHLELIASLPESRMMIEADGRHLWRVLENLYNNAFKYAMEGSRVYTEVVSEDGMAYFIIKNVSSNPLNVTPDELTERFVRGDVSRTTEGSGLGLSIAQSLTKLQGGTFEILIDGDLFKARVGFPLV